VCPCQIKNRVRRERGKVMQALWEVWAYSLKVQKWEEGDKEGKPSK